MTRTHNDIQLSRISRVSHPRATIWATLLLVVVFLGFGVWAQAHISEPSYAASLPGSPADPAYINSAYVEQQ